MGRTVPFLLLLGQLVKFSCCEWWQLDSILQNQAQLQNQYDTMKTMACPNDGEPLKQGPPDSGVELYCPFDGWQYPRDYDRNVHSGM